MSLQASLQSARNKFSLLPVGDNRGMALWDDLEELRPEVWTGREDGAATVVSNYGFLSFLARFRDVYARVES